MKSRAGPDAMPVSHSTMKSGLQLLLIFRTGFEEVGRVGREPERVCIIRVPRAAVAVDARVTLPTTKLDEYVRQNARNGSG
jgi:hypothetical protein